MNATGKLISILLYAVALAVTYVISAKNLSTVAIVGLVVFFVVHIALRARQGSGSRS